MSGNRTYPLIVSQNALEGHPTRTEHWALVVLMNAKDAVVFQLIGNYDSFAYETRTITKYETSTTLRGACKVGDIPSQHIQWVADKLREVRIIKGTPQFDCQVWVMNAIRLLKDNTSFILPHITERHVRQELGQEIKRWESADDVFHERTYPRK